MRVVSLCFIRPGKPIENAYVESFNGKFRDECLNEHWLLNMVDAQIVIEAWRLDYNLVRPHSALEGRTPDQFVSSRRGLGGCRRLALTVAKTRRNSHYRCSGCRGHVTFPHACQPSRRLLYTFGSPLAAGVARWPWQIRHFKVIRT